MTAALEGGEWSAARSGRSLPPGKTRYPFYMRLGGPQDRSGRTENLVPIGIRSRTFQPVVSRYTDWATRPTILGITLCIFSVILYRQLRLDYTQHSTDFSGELKDCISSSYVRTISLLSPQKLTTEQRGRPRTRTIGYSEKCRAADSMTKGNKEASY